MSQRLVLHVGTMKTGTSFLQSVLNAERARLIDDGDEFLLGFSGQVRAVKEVLAVPDAHGPVPPTWAQLAQRARTPRRGTAVVSMEFLSFAKRHQVRALLAPLEGLEVRVLITVRDQVGLLPAMWQTYTRNRGASAWPDFLREVERGVRGGRGSRAYRKFRRAQDVEQILERWSVPGVTAIDVVTVPPSGAHPDELWRRFCTASGLQPVDVSGVQVSANESLGYAACDWLRRANPALLDGVDKKTYHRIVRPLATGVLAPLRGHQSRPVLDAPGARFAHERNAALRSLIGDGVTQGRLNLIGDLDDLGGHSGSIAGSIGEGLPDRAEPPPYEQVVQTAHAVHAHASRWLADLGEPADPVVENDDLDLLVSQAVAMLHRAHAAASSDGSISG